MKSLLYIGGPLIATIGFGFYSGLLEFAHNLEGLEHQAGVEQGGTFIMQEDVYQCDESGGNCVLVETNTEVGNIEELPTGISQSANYRLEEQQTGFSDISGLEIEEQPIEYRNGSEDITVRKQPGLSKYANITFRRPTGFDWKTLRFEFERQLAIEEINKEYDEKVKEVEGEEMIQIDPPVLVIPTN